MKTLNVVVADGVLEMTPKQRGELLKLVQEMGDIDINSSEVKLVLKFKYPKLVKSFK